MWHWAWALSSLMWHAHQPFGGSTCLLAFAVATKATRRAMAPSAQPEVASGAVASLEDPAGEAILKELGRITPSTAADSNMECFEVDTLNFDTDEQGSLCAGGAADEPPAAAAASGGRGGPGMGGRWTAEVRREQKTTRGRECWAGKDYASRGWRRGKRRGKPRKERAAADGGSGKSKAASEADMTCSLCDEPKVKGFLYCPCHKRAYECLYRTAKKDRTVNGDSGLQWISFRTIFGDLKDKKQYPGDPVRQRKVILDFVAENPDGKEKSRKKRLCNDLTAYVHERSCFTESAEAGFWGHGGGWSGTAEEDETCTAICTAGSCMA